jgi:hypothetical protein
VGLVASGGVERQDCDLGGAVEAKWEANSAEAAVDVELHLVETVVALGVLDAHGGEDEWAEEGKSDLTAVRVAGEHEIDERAAGMGHNGVGIVRLMSHEDDGTVRFGWDSEIKVRVTGACVVQTAKPDACTVALDREVLVEKYRGAAA